ETAMQGTSPMAPSRSRYPTRVAMTPAGFESQNRSTAPSTRPTSSTGGGACTGSAACAGWATPAWGAPTVMVIDSGIVIVCDTAVGACATTCGTGGVDADPCDDAAAAGRVSISGGRVQRFPRT